MARTTGLSQERIIDAALRLVDEGGLRGLTMRGLAEELGVGPMTLYGYFRTKDELLDGVVDAVVDQIQPPPDVGSWQDRLAHCMVELARALTLHPSVSGLFTARPLSAGTLRSMSVAVDLLREAGFDDDEAVRAHRALLAYTFGFAGFTGPTKGDKDAGSKPRSRRRGNGSSAAARWEAAEPQFTFGLQTLLAGFEARLKKSD